MFEKKEKKMDISPMGNVVDKFRRDMPPMSLALRGNGSNVLGEYLRDSEDLVQWAARNGLGTNAVELRLGAQYFSILANTVLEQMHLGNNMIRVLSGANRQIYDICTQKDPVAMANKALGLCEQIALNNGNLSKQSEKGFLGIGIRKKDTDWDKLVGFGIVQPWMGLIENIAKSAPAIRRDIRDMTKEEVTQAANYIRLKKVVNDLREGIKKRDKKGNQLVSRVNTKVVSMEGGVNKVNFQNMRERLTKEMQGVITAVAKREDVRDRIQSLESIVLEMEKIPEASVEEMRECIRLGLDAARVYTAGLGIEAADAVYEAAALQGFTTIVNAVNLSMIGVLGLSQAVTSAAIMNTQITTAMLGEMSVEVNSSKFDPREVMSVVLERWRGQKQAIMKQSRVVNNGNPDEVNLQELAEQIGENETLLNSGE